ncbi:MAG: hypothetical protein ABSG24_06235 [Acidimicrobiales bacterium]
MKLDVYRSCSRQEKRDVLEAFWRRGVTPSPRIHEAAHQYGPYAVLCLVAVALELAFMLVVTLHRAIVVGSLAAALEALVLVSLWWALVRYRALTRPSG